MLIYDDLDHLEDYVRVVPGLEKVIDVMDHSAPYDDNPGLYDIPGLKDKKYLVEIATTSPNGKMDKLFEGKIVEIALEGRYANILEGNVAVMMPGSFFIYDTNEYSIIRLSGALPSESVKCVRFIL